MLAQEQAHTFMNGDNQTALHLAAKQDACLTRDGLSHDVDIIIRNVSGETSLTCAVNVKNIGTVTLLLKIHVNVNVIDDQQATCLYLVASKDEIWIHNLVNLKI